MDNLTHSLAGALIGQMGLKRASRFALAGCILGANAPDIDVIAPLFLPVDNIAFHRGPTHALFGLPVMAACTVALLWLIDRIRPGKAGDLPFRAGPLFLVTLLAVATHPFLDWLTTYAVAFFAPAGERWYSANAIFIIDWVYWIVLGLGIWLSVRRWRGGAGNPGRPAQVAGVILLLYIAANVAWSAHAERTLAAALRQRGIQPRLIVASPPPFAFWERSMAWRSDREWGAGSFSPGTGLLLEPAVYPLGLDDPRFLRARAERRIVRSFLYWSRMPIVVEVGGRPVLTDQRYHRNLDDPRVPAAIRRRAPRGQFQIPLDLPSRP
ncbi:inner membrane protein [Sphingomonas kaistensis]|uniref:Inner membrane protein n=1 Tax=Sphingomonas kaistensis TaxID=298708 RepID=A0A7X6BGI7_9SPHN|nr:metal-dependent hydrolase [Sphingomonas kaistensis]NJC05903.1 inner membrane protein [Sphingomonas kaistensis]